MSERQSGKEKLPLTSNVGKNSLDMLEISGTAQI